MSFVKRLAPFPITDSLSFIILFSFVPFSPPPPSLSLSLSLSLFLSFPLFFSLIFTQPPLNNTFRGFAHLNENLNVSRIRFFSKFFSCILLSERIKCNNIIRTILYAIVYVLHLCIIIIITLRSLY